MREKLAHALNSSNLKQTEQYCSTDSLLTLGIAAINHPVGVAALHVIDALQPQAYNELIYSLSRKASKQIKCDKQILLRVCKQVVYESAITKCKDCSGVSHHIVNHKVVHCPTCNGTGLNRHTDYERSRALKISEEEYTKHWASRFDHVQSIYTGECRAALHVSRKINENN